MTVHQDDREAAFPADLAAELDARGIMDQGEVALRRELERHVPGFNLFRLTPAAARRWKCRYRVMIEAGYYDGQSVAEAYGRALISVLSARTAGATHGQATP